MVSCTTNLRGKYKISLHDAGQPEDQHIEVNCRVHAIAYRGAEVTSKGENIPYLRGTWYLITLEKFEWKQNPMWVHEGNSLLNLGF